MSENLVLLGADPEAFVIGTVRDHRGRAINRTVMPAFGLFGGNKDEPNKMTDMEDGYLYLEDNAALEFNIPPQKTAQAFCDAIGLAKEWIRHHLLEPKELEFADSNVLKLTPQWAADPRAHEVGCMPDHDAYVNDGAPRERFDADKLGQYRYSGGHFHISYNCGVLPQFVAARFLDLHLTLRYMEYDRQPDRRSTYGKAGLFRPKKYGIEYRTMSNWWLWMGEGVLRSVAESALTFARRSYDAEYLGLLSEAYVGMPWNDVQRAINNEDNVLGMQLIDLADRHYNLDVRGARNRRR